MNRLMNLLDTAAVAVLAGLPGHRGATGHQTSQTPILPQADQSNPPSGDPAANKEEEYSPASNTNLAGWAAAHAAGWGYISTESYAEYLMLHTTEDRVILWVILTLILMVPFFAAFKISSMLFQNSIVRFVSDAALSLVLVGFTMMVLV